MSLWEIQPTRPAQRSRRPRHPARPVARALNETEKAETREISRTRAGAEHPFAVMSGQAGRMTNLCHNLRRHETLVRKTPRPPKPV